MPTILQAQLESSDDQNIVRIEVQDLCGCTSLKIYLNINWKLVSVLILIHFIIEYCYADSIVQFIYTFINAGNKLLSPFPVKLWILLICV